MGYSDNKGLQNQCIAQLFSVSHTLYKDCNNISMAPKKAILTTQNIDFVQKIDLKSWSDYHNISNLQFHFFYLSV